MAGIDDDYADLIDSRSRGFSFPSATQGLSSAGVRQLNQYNQMIGQLSGADAALMELQLEKSRFDFQKQSRDIQIALQQQRDKNRIAEHGITGIKTLPTLAPESDGYLTQRNELIQKIPYAMYDDGFKSALGIFDDRNRRYSELKEQQRKETDKLKQDETKANQREAFAIYKQNIASLSPLDVLKYGSAVTDITPDSPMEKILEANTVIKKAQAMDSLNQRLVEFGYNPEEFSGDVTKMASVVDRLSRRKAYLETQRKGIREEMTILNAAIQATDVKMPTEAQKAYSNELFKKLSSVTEELDGMDAKKSLSTPQAESVPAAPQPAKPSGRDATISYFKALASAPTDSEVTNPDGKPIKATKAVQERARKALAELGAK